MNDEEFMRELIGIYLDDSGKQLDLLRQAVESQDPERTSAAAHRLHGASGNIGAARLSQLCHDLETFGRRGETSPFAGVFRDVDEELGRVREALTAVLEGEVRNPPS